MWSRARTTLAAVAGAAAACTLLPVTAAGAAALPMGTTSVAADVTSTSRVAPVLRAGRLRDGTPPSLRITTPASGAATSPVFTVSGTAADNARLRRVVVGLEDAAPVVAVGTGTWSVQLGAADLPDGPHRVTVTVTDAAGNLRRTTRTVLVDRAAAARVPSTPPAPQGYFTLHLAGTPTALPTGEQCRSRIRRSTWEPRPMNSKRNAVVPDRAAVARSLASHKRSTYGTYDARWDSWLLARVDGSMTGTTDEILQWAACKWGLPDNLVRAVAHHESTWNQYLTYAGTAGRPVSLYGSGDFPAAGSSDPVYAASVRRLGGFDYTPFYGAGVAPRTFSIVGVMSYDGWRPDWPDATNGTFPFNRDSTAFAVDYMAAELRGCYEGWKLWLGDVSDGRYRAGDMGGCLGSWFSGAWHSAAGDAYAQGVLKEAASRPWLAPSYPGERPPCHAAWGCPGPDPLP